jgi:hypothetical protein
MDTPTGGTYHRGGPHWPDWDNQTAARYCAGGAPLDEEPPAAEPTATLTGTVAWGGAVTWHFGHQISDFTTRLLPTLAEVPDARFAYSTHAQAQLRSVDYAPKFFPQILAWYGISPERIEMIADPTLVERLIVAPQAEQTHGPGPEPWYLDLLDANMTARLGTVNPRGSLYVSRAGIKARFAGEAYLERVLEDAGFRVLRPETVSLEEQLRAYAGAESIIFAEGSAMHGAQLLGRALGDVTVLVRRSDLRLVEKALRPRARSLLYVDAVAGLVHGCDINGHPARYRGLSILDAERLRTFLPIGGVWDREAFETARDADIAEWLERERQTPRWAVPGSPELISESLEDAGLDPALAYASPGTT